VKPNVKLDLKRTGQRGVALLSVSILLVVLGALAFSLSRQGAMAAHAVDAQYDTETARYLAEAGLNVAGWRDRQTGCKKNDSLVKPSRIDGSGTYSAAIANGGKTLDIDAVGKAEPGGAQFALSRNNVPAHTNVASDVTLGGGAGEDTFLTADAALAPQHGRRYLELTQARSAALLQFDLPGDFDGAVVVKAELTLRQYQSNSVLPALVASVHRVTRDWDNNLASWIMARLLTGWTSAGGDYMAGNVAALTIAGNNTYTWDVTALADGWANRAFPNYGLLLLADGPLQQARFYGFQSGQSTPALHLTYYRKC
jgi:hypothetical protein